MTSQPFTEMCPTLIASATNSRGGRPKVFSYDTGSDVYWQIGTRYKRQCAAGALTLHLRKPATRTITHHSFSLEVKMKAIRIHQYGDAATLKLE